MKHIYLIFSVLVMSSTVLKAQYIPIDTSHWQIQAQSYVIEQFEGKSSIYLQGGSMGLKDGDFENGTIEYKIWLKQEQSFPGVYFRYDLSTNNAEQFYLRPHLPGKPDATQALPLIRGISAWQLYFGEKYSFPYEFNYDRWTSVKIKVKEDKAQVFIDGSDKPNLSWKLYHNAAPGKLILNGGNMSGMHISDIKVDYTTPTLDKFEAGERSALEGIVKEWAISDKFEEAQLNELGELQSLIKSREWPHKIGLDESTAVNISKEVTLRDGTNKNTVFAKVVINSRNKQTKRFAFGYSDRVVVILNGQPIYRGTNKWRSRDYRYLGTIGLFDEVYLDLKKGENELLFAVSEDFGGWLITGKLIDKENVTITVN